jgi:hypothetical protein
VFTLGRDRRYRILDVQPPPTEAAIEDITAVWTVEPVAVRAEREFDGSRE